MRKLKRLLAITLSLMTVLALSTFSVSADAMSSDEYQSACIECCNPDNQQFRWTPEEFENCEYSIRHFELSAEFDRFVEETIVDLLREADLNWELYEYEELLIILTDLAEEAQLRMSDFYYEIETRAMCCDSPLIRVSHITSTHYIEILPNGNRSCSMIRITQHRWCITCRSTHTPHSEVRSGCGLNGCRSD